MAGAAAEAVVAVAVVVVAVVADVAVLAEEEVTGKISEVEMTVETEAVAVEIGGTL